MNTLNNEKRLHCGFIDYSKTFDSVYHEELWFKITKRGLNSKLTNVIKPIYNQVKSCVKCHSDVSNYFFVKSGLFQDEVCLRYYLSLFMIYKWSKTSNQSHESVIFSKNASELQNMLNIQLSGS